MRNLGGTHQYACFECRKCFKRPQMSGALNRFMTQVQRQAQLLQAQQLNEGRAYLCPNCGAPCHFMGLDFKAPKSTNLKAWRNVEVFIRSGKVYYRGRS